MRSKKFRVLDDRNRWHYFDLNDLNSVPVINTDSLQPGSHQHSILQKTVSQGIGFMDDKEVDIYEGDIVKVIDYPYLPYSMDKDTTAPFERLYVIVYDAPEFTFSWFMRFDYNLFVEVIGNIFQNENLIDKHIVERYYKKDIF